MINAQQIRWACRRGMLELDLLLLPFFEEVFPTCDEQEQNLFVELLSSTDQELYHWLLGSEEAPLPHLIPIIEHIRQYAQQIKVT